MNAPYSSPAFEDAYTYSGNDLGAYCDEKRTFFRLWAPTALSVRVLLYRSGDPENTELLRAVTMNREIQGTWTATVPGMLHGIYYTYSVTLPDRTVEAADPYARSAGVNGIRSMVVDLSRTNPAGWHSDRNPHAGERITDAIIYELHIRDFTLHSGTRRKGQFLGVSESDTRTVGVVTGLDHLLDLGITHVQLMPIYDFGSVDEAHPERKQYNWGYDPMNFNIPEGSYSSDAHNGLARVTELKHMIKLLHSHGISVVMDVVYNHVYHAEQFCFNQIVPGYFSREHSNGSGCGNDTASERSMVRKYIVDSVNYWADEYHIDGFRFDLVGLIDIETIRSVMETVKRRHPDCLFYGEGWHMGTNPTKSNISFANQGNSHMLPDFAFFNDTFRDTLRGSVFNSSEKGFLSGNFSGKQTLEASFTGSVHWAQNPSQSVNYISCHDNNTLFDRLALALPEASRQELILRNRLAAAFTLLSQGVPLMLAGEELLRTKPGRNGQYISNSYHSPDSVNSIKWNTLKLPEYQETFRYYKGLIALRKAFPVFRQSAELDVKSSVFPLPTSADHLLAFSLYGSDYRLIVIFNAGTETESLPLPDGPWEALVQENRAGIRPLSRIRGNAVVSPLSTLVILQWK